MFKRHLNLPGNTQRLAVILLLLLLNIYIYGISDIYIYIYMTMYLSVPNILNIIVFIYNKYILYLILSNHISNYYHEKIPNYWCTTTIYQSILISVNPSISINTRPQYIYIYTYVNYSYTSLLYLTILTIYPRIPHILNVIFPSISHIPHSVVIINYIYITFLTIDYRYMIYIYIWLYMYMSGGQNYLLHTRNGHGQSEWSPIGCDGLYFHVMCENRVSASG
jgi:hypothetical protein